MTLTIELPWPAKELNPNARVHYMALHHAKKQAKGDAQILTKNELRKSQMEITPPVPVKFTLHPPIPRRHRDTDNMIASTKALADGVSAALGIDDRHFVPVYEVADPVKYGCVIVTIHSSVSYTHLTLPTIYSV